MSQKPRRACAISRGMSLTHRARISHVSDDVGQPFSSQYYDDHACSVAEVTGSPVAYQRGCKREAEHSDTDGNLSDLLELQDSGLKVILPAVKLPRCASPLVLRLDTQAAIPECDSLASLSVGDLQDLIDLAELGGNPDWPPGHNLQSVIEELRCRTERVTSASAVA